MTITVEHHKALSYHPLTEGRDIIHSKLRQAAIQYCHVLDEVCPSSRESSLAFTALQESLMWANAAVAIHDPNLKEGK